MSQSEIAKETLKSAMSYEEYIQLIEKLLKDGKTTGEDQSLSKTEYAELNLRRMRRIEKTFSISEEFAGFSNGLDTPIIWLVLTEGWCGDAAQIIPVLDKLTKRSDQLELKLILRDEHPDLMDQFLTNGSRSIPKLIALDAGSNQVLGSWGPRPAEAQKLLTAFKTTPEMSKDDFSKQIQLWYAKDKGRSIEKELIDLMQNSLHTQ